MDLSPKQAFYPGGALRMAIDVFGAGAAWIMLHSVGYALSSYACYPHARPGDAPAISHFGILMDGIGILCTLAALACSGAALLNWRHLDGANGARRFIAGIGLLTSILFLIATGFTTSAMALVSPCSPWK